MGVSGCVRFISGVLQSHHSLIDLAYTPKDKRPSSAVTQRPKRATGDLTTNPCCRERVWPAEPVSPHCTRKRHERHAQQPKPTLDVPLWVPGIRIAAQEPNAARTPTFWVPEHAPTRTSELRDLEHADQLCGRGDTALVQPREPLRPQAGERLVRSAQTPRSRPGALDREMFLLDTLDEPIQFSQARPSGSNVVACSGALERDGILDYYNIG